MRPEKELCHSYFLYCDINQFKNFTNFHSMETKWDFPYFFHSSVTRDFSFFNDLMICKCISNKCISKSVVVQRSYIVLEADLGLL